MEPAGGPLSAIIYMAMLLLLLAAAAAAAKPSRPANPTNVTVFGLRPYELSHPLLATNYDWGDAGGDIFFLMTDVLSLPYACNVSNNSWWACRQRGALGHDQVYTELVLEVDGSLLPDGTLDGATYADCNPDGSVPPHFNCDCLHHRAAAPGAAPGVLRSAAARLQSHQRYRCDMGPAYVHCGDFTHRNLTTNLSMSACVSCFMDATGCSRGAVWDRCAYLSTKVSCEIFGAEPIPARYCGADRSDGSKLTEACPSCADGCSGVWDHWKSSTARVLGGNWYSTADEGDCDDPAAPGCGWRVLQHIKTVNATCANNNLIAAVETRGKKCFINGGCPKLSDGSGAYDRSTNCWVECFFSAVLGPAPPT